MTAAASEAIFSPVGAIEQLIEELYTLHGCDYRLYARGSLERRVLAQVAHENVDTVGMFRERLRSDEAMLARFVAAMSVHSTSMFRHPAFHVALRQRVCPLLRTYPSIRVWVPGCSSGEDVYATAIVLREEGLYARTHIYATDGNEAVLSYARAGVYPLENFGAAAADYLRAGGSGSLRDYYTPDGEQGVIDPVLRERITFAQHSLATDASFNEVHLIVCRDVLIYFERSLAQRAYALFHESLCRFGFLGVGRSESLASHPFEQSYEAVAEKIYRRVAQ